MTGMLASVSLGGWAVENLARHVIWLAGMWLLGFGVAWAESGRPKKDLPQPIQFEMYDASVSGVAEIERGDLDGNGFRFFLNGEIGNTPFLYAIDDTIGLVCLFFLKQQYLNSVCDGDGESIHNGEYWDRFRKLTDVALSMMATSARADLDHRYSATKVTYLVPHFSPTPLNPPLDKPGRMEQKVAAARQALKKADEDPSLRNPEYMEMNIWGPLRGLEGLVTSMGFKYYTKEDGVTSAPTTGRMCLIPQEGNAVINELNITAAHVLNRRHDDGDCGSQDFGFEFSRELMAKLVKDYEAGLAVGKGAEKFDAGDWEGAVAEYTRALESDPDNSSSLTLRGITQYRLGRYEEAVADFERVCEGDPENQETGQLHQFVARARGGDVELAKEKLKTYLGERWTGEPGDWFSVLADFLLGEIDEKELFAGVSDESVTDGDTVNEKEKRCQAWFYAGFRHLLGGNKEKARQYFQRSVATEETRINEYRFAQAELALSE